MKALLAALALFVGINAHARSIQVGVAHVLPNVTIDGQPSDLVGVLNIDLLTSEITLRLFDDICGNITAAPGTITCKAAPVLEAEYVVPLQKRKYGPCNTAIYAGKRDQRPVDGNLTVIKVEDDTHRTCDDVRLNLVKVEVVSKTAGMGGPSKAKVIEATKSY